MRRSVDVASTRNGNTFIYSTALIYVHVDFRIIRVYEKSLEKSFEILLFQKKLSIKLSEL